jgi:hypothetical protein
MEAVPAAIVLHGMHVQECSLQLHLKYAAAALHQHGQFNIALCT